MSFQMTLMLLTNSCGSSAECDTAYGLQGNTIAWKHGRRHSEVDHDSETLKMSKCKRDLIKL